MPFVSSALISAVRPLNSSVPSLPSPSITLRPGGKSPINASDPCATEATTVITSPSSGSTRVAPASTMPVPSLVVTLSTGSVRTGASFTGLTVSVKEYAMVDVPSVTSTVRGTTPSASGGGVPSNVPVEASKLNQIGSADPPANVAVSVRFEESGSENVLAGMGKCQSLP